MFTFFLILRFFDPIKIIQQLLSQLMERLQEHFAPYLSQIVNATAPLLKSIHDDIRTYAISLFPQIIRATGRAGVDRSTLVTLAGNTVTELAQLIRNEDNFDVLIPAIESLGSCILFASGDWSNKDTPLSADLIQGFLPPTLMSDLIDCIEIVIGNAIQRRAVLKAEAQVIGDVDEEDEEDEKLLTTDNLEIYFNISELLCSIFRSHGESFLPHFERASYSRLKTMAHPYCLVDDRNYSLSVIGDLLNYGIQTDVAAAKYYPELLEILVSAVSTADHTDIRTLAASGIKVAVKKHPSIFAPFSTPGKSWLLFPRSYAFNVLKIYILYSSAGSGHVDIDGIKWKCTR